MTNPFSRTHPSTRPLLNAQEIGVILNAIDVAALLVDNTSNKIVAVNSILIESSGYSHETLMSMRVDELIGGQESDPDQEGQALTGRDPTIEDLLTKGGDRVPHVLQSKSIGKGTSWWLITLESIKMERNAISTKHSHSHGFIQQQKLLLEALKTPNPDEALERLIVAAREYLGDGPIGIYLGSGQQPRVNLIKSKGGEGFFPNEISPPDLNQLLKASYWVRGKASIVTMLHQSARALGYAYLASAPIRESDESRAWTGIIVAAGKDLPPANPLSYLKILGSITSVVIQKNLLMTNLNQAINENRQRLSVWEAVRKTVRDGIITVSDSMEIQYLNQSAELILGYVSDEVEGFPVDNVIIGTDRLMPALRRALRGEPTPYLGQVELHRRDGSTFPAELKINSIHNHADISGALILLSDTSESEQIRLRTQQLEQRALLGEVTSIFAHEVRNPINNISTSLQLLERELPEEDARQKRIANMQEDCQRLTDLMESVLAFSRTGNYQFTSFQLQELLDRIINRCTRVWPTPTSNAKWSCPTNSQRLSGIKGV